MTPAFSLLVPVKVLARSKSRLEVGNGLGRAALMRAFALDAIESAVRSPSVARLFLVTSESDLVVPGTTLLPDEGYGDLNRSLRRAAHRVRLTAPDLGVAAMCADLPALRTDDLTAALESRPAARWFVADAAGTGTTLLAARPGVDLNPGFGPSSALRHQRSGASPLHGGLASLRLDVDTGQDLARAAGLGVGSHTSVLLSLTGRGVGGRTAKYRPGRESWAPTVTEDRTRPASQVLAALDERCE